jgi:hypothetical protein
MAQANKKTLKENRRTERRLEKQKRREQRLETKRAGQPVEAFEAADTAASSTSPPSS